MDKTCYTIFKSRFKKTPNNLNNIKIYNAIIKRVPASVKYLGVILDENLRWDEHIETLTRNIMKTANSFKIIKRRVHEENKNSLYYAYIYSNSNSNSKVFIVSLVKYLQ